MSLNEIYDVVPISQMRKAIATRMTSAKQSIPHFRMSVEIDADNLLAFRKRININNVENTISITDLTIKACASALMAVPSINIQFIGDKMHQYKQANISVIVAINGGLAEPVLRNANEKTIYEISKNDKILTGKSVEGKLKANEISGGSFSI